MLIKKYGTVTIGENAISIQGWTVEREPSDPADATDNQLLLALAIAWARARFEKEVRSAALTAFRQMVAAEQAKKKDPGENFN